MLFVRLLLVGTDSSYHERIIQCLHDTQESDENQSSNESRGGALRICDKKVKIECITPFQMVEYVQSQGTRYWTKVKGIVFLHDATSSSSLPALKNAFDHLQQKNYTQNNYSLLLLETGTSKPTAASFCDDFDFKHLSLTSTELTKTSGKLVFREFEHLITEINEKQTNSPKASRKRVPKVSIADINEDTIEIPSNILTAGSCSLPSATSEQVAQILSEPAAPSKKKRRKSFLNNLKSANKKRKKRRESLLESVDSESDSEDCEPGTSASQSIEEMEGHFTLDALLEFMIFSASSVRENLIENILLCLSSCFTPLSFAQQLVLRWDTGNMKGAKAQNILRQRIANIVYGWLELSPASSFETETFRLLKGFIFDHIVHVEGGDAVAELWKQSQLRPKEQKKRFTASITHDAPMKLSPRPPKSKKQLNLQTSNEALNMYKQYSPLEVASQLTLLEYSRFSRISVQEFTNVNWTRKEKDYLSPNLLHMIHHSTFVTLWIQTMVLSESDVKDRAKVIKWCVMVAQKCRELSNFNSVMAIIGGLQSCPVDRLKRTWEEVGLKYRRKVEQLFDLMVRENYKEYRTIIHSCSGPCVPFPGMWLSDLQFIESANDWYQQNGDERVVNLSKIGMVSRILRHIKRLQKTPYGLQENHDIRNLLRSVVTIDDEVAYSVSIELEPVLTGSDYKNSSYIGEIDTTKCLKFEARAQEIRRDPQEIVDLLEKWNRTLRDDGLMKETLCASNGLEILLVKLASIEEEEIPAPIQRELKLRLNQLFSYCLVGDTSKHQQLLECLRRLQIVKSTESDDLSRRLIRCFKVPPQYRQLSHQLSETQAQITKTREQQGLLEQTQIVADKDHKEHQVHRKRLDNQIMIISLQQQKENLISQKDEKKLKILEEFNAISIEIQSKFAVESSVNVAGWTDDLMTLSKNMKGSDKEYIEEKRAYQEEKVAIQNQRKELEEERQRIVEMLAKVDRRLNRLDQTQTGLDDGWNSYKKDFSTAKHTLVAQTDDLMNLIDEAEYQHKSSVFLHSSMTQFHKFFSSVLNLQTNSTTTKQQAEQQNATERDIKRFLQSLLPYIKYFEHALYLLHDKWEKNFEILQEITALQLSHEVLLREFPQYDGLLDKAKNIKKEFIRVKKEYASIDIQQWNVALSHPFQEANRCHSSIERIEEYICLLEECIAKL